MNSAALAALGVNDDQKIIISRSWYRLFPGNEPFVKVLWAYSWIANFPEEWVDKPIPRIRQEVEYSLSERTIQVTRRLLIEMGLLEQKPGSGNGGESVTCRVNWDYLRKLLGAIKESAAKLTSYIKDARAKARAEAASRLKQSALFPHPANLHDAKPAPSDGLAGNFASPLPANLHDHPYKDSNQDLKLASYPPPAKKQPLPEAIREALNGHVFMGLALSDHTVNVLTGHIRNLPEPEQSLAVAELSDRCDRYVDERRQKTLGWGAVVNDTKSAIRNRAYLAYAPIAQPVEVPAAISEPIEVCDLPSTDIRASYTADQIREESRLWLLNPCGLDIKREFELDQKRRRKSPAHAEAVDRRWQLPLFTSPNLDWNDPKYADKWQWDHYMHLPWPELVPQRKPVAREESLKAFAASAARA